LCCLIKDGQLGLEFHASWLVLVDVCSFGSIGDDHIDLMDASFGCTDVQFLPSRLHLDFLTNLADDS
jgi:hypothetical protein